MLSWFEVENFKSIKKLRLEFSPFMVFVGPNGAGKTNIVQALELFLEILKEGTTEPIEAHGGFEQLIRRQRHPMKMGMRFALGVQLPVALLEDHLNRGPKQSSVIFKVEIVFRPSANHDGPRAVSETLRLEDGEHSPLVAQWSEQKEKPVIDLGSVPAIKSWLRIWPEVAGDMHHWIEQAWLQDSARLKIANLLVYINPFLLSKVPEAKRLRLDSSALRSDSPLGARRQGDPLSLAGDGLPLAIERMRRAGKSSGHFQRVLDRLREVYPRITAVSTAHYQPGRVALSFQERSISGQLGEANISDGVMHALALLVALEATAEKDVLAIEEPENALHPWALRKIITRAQEGPPRAEPLLITTHSPVVVDAVKDPASLFIVEYDDKKGTTVTPAIEKESALRSILAESGQTLGDIWLDGTLGGVPGGGR